MNDIFTTMKITIAIIINMFPRSTIIEKSEFPHNKNYRNQNQCINVHYSNFYQHLQIQIVTLDLVAQNLTYIVLNSVQYIKVLQGIN